MNLITNLTEKLKKVGYKLSDTAQALLNKIHITGKSKIAKSIASLALCSAMVLGVSTLSACSACNNINPGPGTERPTPGGDNPGGTNPGGTNPGGDNPGGENNNNELDKYSQILQTVLTDEYYAKVIDRNKTNAGTIYFTNAEMYAAPYYFLKNQGHDIDSVINGDLECKTSIYTKDDDSTKLYISVRIENEGGSKNYYTNYVLKYALNKKEYNDLYMLYENNYAQAPLFIQELSKQKTATVESKVNITKSGYEKIVHRIMSVESITKPLFGTKDLDIDLTYASTENDEQQLGLIIRNSAGYKDMIVNNSQSRYLHLILHKASLLTLNNNVFNIAQVAEREANLDEFNAKYTPITYFNLADITAEDKLTVS